jgi:hypothetical protein
MAGSAQRGRPQRTGRWPLPPGALSGSRRAGASLAKKFIRPRPAAYYRPVASIDLESSLDLLEGALATGELADGRPALAYLAGRGVTFGEAELHGARRRALLLLATGGDPRFGLGLEGRAVTALAGDLDRPERRASLSEGLLLLRGACGDRPRVAQALDALVSDSDIAWHSLASALLAEELDE